MQTVIFILSLLDCKSPSAVIKKAKKELVAYVGTRMLVENKQDDNAPGIIVEGKLSQEDKKKISDINKDLLFIFAETKTLENPKDYIECTLT